MHQFIPEDVQPATDEWKEWEVVFINFRKAIDEKREQARQRWEKKAEERIQDIMQDKAREVKEEMNEAKCESDYNFWRDREDRDRETKTYSHLTR